MSVDAALPHKAERWIGVKQCGTGLMLSPYRMGWFVFTAEWVKGKDGGSHAGLIERDRDANTRPNQCESNHKGTPPFCLH